MAAKLATLNELQTVLGVADLYNLVEVVQVDAFNHQLAAVKD